MRRRPHAGPCRLAEIRGRFPRQRRQHQRHHVGEALVPGLLLQEVAAEDHAERGAVGEIEKAQRRRSRCRAAPDRPRRGNRRSRRRAVTTVRIISTNGECIDLTLVERFRWRALREVFGVEQRQKFRIAEEVIPGEVDQPLDRLGRIEMLEIEPALLGTDLLIGAFEHREVEIVLVADVVIQHALVGAGIGRDAVDPRAGQAMGGEFLLGGLENADPHPLGIALPFQNAFCLGQISCSLRAHDVRCSTHGAI